MGKIKRDILNNWYILKCIYNAGKITFFVIIINILVETAAYYVGTNMGLWVFDAVETNTFYTSVLLVLIIYAILLASQSIAKWLNMYSYAFASTRITEYIMKKVIRKSFEIRQKEVENPGFYDRYSRAISEVGTRPGEVLKLVSGVLGGVIQLFTVSAIVSQLSLGYTAIILVASILSTIISLMINSIEYKRYEDFTKVNRKLSYVNRVIYQPEYSRLLRNNAGYESLLTQYYAHDTEEYRGVIRKYNNKLYLLAVLQGMVTTVFLGIGPWVVMIYGLKNGMITFGQVTVMLSAATYLPQICDKLFGAMVSVRKQSMYIENLRYVLDYEGGRKKEEKKANDEETDVVLETQSVLFSYSPGSKLILRNINIQIKEGEKVALVGPNGAGKTTLACVLAGLYTPSEGHVYLEGANIEKVTLDYINEKIIMINQDVCALSFTIAENVLQRPLETIEDYRIVEDALKKVGMYEKIVKLKNGVDTYVSKEFDDDGVVLSGGELQKLAIARVYASEAKIVIMDEPTSALDAISEQEIVDLLFELLADRTIIIISHRLSFMKKINTIYYIDGGRVAESGSHVELLQRKDKYYELYGTQAERYMLCEGETNA